MRGIPLPDREADFAADPSELFFDLVFVFAFSRLVFLLVDRPDWTGVGRFALLFVLIWLPWSTFTWSANAVAGNSRPVRFLFLVATVASIPMAGSITSAFDDGAPAFAISASIILAMGLLTMIAGVGPEPEVRASAVRYSIPNLVAIVVMVAGAYVSGGTRVVAWVAAVTIVAVGMLRAGSSEWLIRPSHFAERHGLLMIVALGEVIVAIGTPVVDSLDEGFGLPARTASALIGAGTFAGLLWWGYFDRPGPSVERRHHAIEEPMPKARYARDVYTVSHVPLVAGVILAAAALEEITVHPDQPLPGAFRWMLLAGLTLHLGAVGLIVARAFRAVAIERLVAIPALLVIVLVTAQIDGIALLVVVDAVLAVMLAAEHLRVEFPHRHEVAARR